MKRLRQTVGWLGLAAVLLVTACGLPGDLKKEAKEKPGLIESTADVVAKQKSKYLQFTKTDRFEFYRIYAGRENWAQKFTEAEKKLELARHSVEKGRVAFLLKDNKKAKAGKMSVELAKVDRMIRSAMNLSRAPTLRMAEIDRIKKEAPQRVQTARASMDKINLLIKKLEEDFIPKARKDYPKRAADILKRYTPVKNLQQEAVSGLDMAEVNLIRHEAGQSADYAILGEKTSLVNANYDKLKAGDVAYRKDVGQLYLSYSKVLRDMKIDYYVTIGRSSWDEGSDFWIEHNYVYPPSRVEQKVFDYFAKLKPNAVPARYSKSWGGSYKKYVAPDYWNALKIQPTRNWPSRADNEAEFWIEDTTAKAYHKYTLVKDGKQQQTGWVSIDEEDYWDYYDYLGMEIVSKPYGFFEDEKITEASPPGMAYVGDSRYGEWRTDTSTGRSFWHYYGIYAFLNRGPGHYYYRNDWNTWRNRYRNKEPYYGGSAGSGPLYGTSGTFVRTNSQYKGTNFARTGGLRTSAASVRGAGPAARGGGPGGRGK